MNLDVYYLESFGAPDPGGVTYR